MRNRYLYILALVIPIMWIGCNNTFKYLYKIINVEDAKSMMNDVEIQTRARIRDAFAGDDKLKIFTDNKVYIDYIYTDESGDTLRVIHITPEDYKK